MKKEECDNCKYSKFWNTATKEYYGICRKNTPVVLVNPQSNSIETVFPEVYGYQWCGEYQKSILKTKKR